MKKNYKPTDSELEILQILWTKGPSSVRDVHEQLSEKKSVFYTTTLKTMQVMHDKGILGRDTSSRSHIYSAKIHKTAVQNTMIERLKDSVFGGSMSELILSAIGNQKPDEKDLAEIKSLINKLSDNE